MRIAVAFWPGPRPRTARDDHDYHRLARRLERRDQRLLIGWKRGRRVVAEALGVCLLADDYDRRVRRLGTRDRRRLVGA
jgi:hypothetical protein